MRNLCSEVSYHSNNTIKYIYSSVNVFNWDNLISQYDMVKIDYLQDAHITATIQILPMLYLRNTDGSGCHNFRSYIYKNKITLS